MNLQMLAYLNLIDDGDHLPSVIQNEAPASQQLGHAKPEWVKLSTGHGSIAGARRRQSCFPCWQEWDRQRYYQWRNMASCAEEPMGRQEKGV